MVLNKIGLTGATGMLGRNLRTALEEAGAKVISISRKSESGSGIAGWDLTEWRALSELDELFGDAQAVVHAGAMVQTIGRIDEQRMFDTNVRACVNLGQWAISRSVPVVHVSSSSVYADTTADGLREDAPLGWGGLGGFYSFTKLLAEDVLKRLGQQGLKLAIVRPSSTYGYGLPNDKTISRFLASASSGTTIELVQPVHDKVDLIHVTDVSRAILAILERDVWDTFNIASGYPVSVKELAEACIFVAGRGRVIIKASESPPRAPVTRFALDTSRAQRLLGWGPAVDLKHGLTMMVQKRMCPKSHESIQTKGSSTRDV